MSGLTSVARGHRDFLTGLAVVAGISLWLAGAPSSFLFASGNNSSALAFEAFQGVQPGNLSVVSSSVGDVDGDGFGDIVTMGFGSRLMTVFGHANGTPTEGPSWESPVTMHQFTIGDFNSDGRADLVGFFPGNGTAPAQIAVAAGKGDGTFGKLLSVYSGFSSTTIQSIEVADLDGDSADDIIVPVRDEGTVAIIRGGGDMTFDMPWVIPVTGPSGRLTVGVRAGDFDNDGDMDLAVLDAATSCCSDSDRIVQLLQVGGNMTPQGPIDNLPVAWNIEAGSAAGDVDGDGYQDLVTSNGQNHSVSLFLGGPRGLRPPIVIDGLDFPLSVAVADLDQDGYADIVSGNDGSSSPEYVTVFRGGETVGAGIYLGGSLRNTFVHTLDFNGDGLLDIASVDISESIVGVLLQKKKIKPDTTPPVIKVPGNFTVEAETIAIYVVTATDDVSGNVTPSCMPESGFTAVFGPNHVGCSAVDAAGNSATASFFVTGVDTTPPKVTISGNNTPVQVGLPVFYFASAHDIVSGNLTPSCAPPSGFAAKPGNNSVTCVAVDNVGLTGSAMFFAFGVDTIAPKLQVPGNISVPATSAAGAIVSYNVSASDAPNPAPPTIACSPKSGSQFAIGTKFVSCTATDAAGNNASAGFAVTVHSPLESIARLQQMAAAAGMTQGDNSLVNVIKHLTRPVGNTLNPACNNLDAFITKALRLPAPQGPPVVDEARRIGAVMGCKTK